jgi:hypothetical protein
MEIFQELRGHLFLLLSWSGVPGHGSWWVSLALKEER